MQSFRLPAFAALGFILLLVLMLPACGVGQLQQMARGEIQAPKVTFQDLKIYQPTSQGWPLGAVLLLDNPNPQPLNLLGYDCQLWLEGKAVARSTSREAINLPPTGQTVAEVPVVVQLPAVMELLPRFLPRQFSGAEMPQPRLHYQIAGSFRLASVMGGIIPIPFRFQGETTPQQGLDFLRPYVR